MTTEEKARRIVQAADDLADAPFGGKRYPQLNLVTQLKFYGVDVARAVLAEGYAADFKLASNERPEGTPPPPPVEKAKEQT